MNVGIIGLGFMGKRRAKAVANCQDRIIAVCDVNLEKAKSLAIEYKCDFTDKWQELVNRQDVEAVIVSVTNDRLCEVATAGLKAKKHVLCEKPLGRNLIESRRIYRISQASGSVLKTGFDHRFHPAIMKAHELVKKNAIGEIMYIRSVYGHGGREGYDQEWRMDPKLSFGGELTDQGVHLLDLFRWFMGEFNEVFAMNENMFWKKSLFEDNSFILLRTAQGQVASAQLSLTQWRNKFLFEIFGKIGYLLVEGLEGSYGQERLVYGKREKLGQRPKEKISKFSEGDSCMLEWKEFTSAIREGRQPLGSGYDGMKTNELLDALYKSAKFKKIIKLGENRGK